MSDKRKILTEDEIYEYIHGLPDGSDSEQDGDSDSDFDVSTSTTNSVLV